MGASELGPFSVAVDEDGVATVIFDRPPVNALSMEVYEAIPPLRRRLEENDVRVAVITALADARAWCGGADLNDFVGMTAEARHERYARINELLPHLGQIERPTIAAIGAHVVGVGTVLAALCDMRYAADSVTFALPEINYGVIPGAGNLLGELQIPRAIVREMIFTGRRVGAEEMYRAGFLNAVVSKGEVLETAHATAVQVAGKSLPAIKGIKRVLTEAEGLGWYDAYLLAQKAALTGGEDAAAGVIAFLEGRTPRIVDR
jgi:enoyl-CoA hydratase/carnithine racemase